MTGALRPRRPGSRRNPPYDGTPGRFIAAASRAAHALPQMSWASLRDRRVKPWMVSTLPTIRRVGQPRRGRGGLGRAPLTEFGKKLPPARGRPCGPDAGIPSEICGGSWEGVAAEVVVVAGVQERNGQAIALLVLPWLSLFDVSPVLPGPAGVCRTTRSPCD